MSYAHAQMMLYRPFLHYVSDKYRSKDLDQRAYACAIACVSVARNIVQIAGEMKKKHLLVGAYWSTMYSTFFAIMALTFFILQNPDEQTSQQVFKDAQDGKDTLAKLAKRSLAADRCSATLSVSHAVGMTFVYLANSYFRRYLSSCLNIFAKVARQHRERNVLSLADQLHFLLRSLI